MPKADGARSQYRHDRRSHPPRLASSIATAFTPISFTIRAPVTMLGDMPLLLMRMARSPRLERLCDPPIVGVVVRETGERCRFVEVDGSHLGGLGEVDRNMIPIAALPPLPTTMIFFDAPLVSITRSATDASSQLSAPRQVETIELVWSLKKASFDRGCLSSPCGLWRSFLVLPSRAHYSETAMAGTSEESVALPNLASTVSVSPCSTTSPCSRR